MKFEMLENIVAISTILVPLSAIWKRWIFNLHIKKVVSDLQIEQPNVDVGIVGDGSFIQTTNCDPDMSNLSNEAIVKSIKRSEEGFLQMETTVDDHVSLDGDVVEFHLVWDDIQTISKALCLDLGTTVSNKKNGVLCAELSDGDFQRIIFNPNDIESTVNLRQIEVWGKESATIRSNRITIATASIWTAVAILVLF